MVFDNGIGPILTSICWCEALSVLVAFGYDVEMINKNKIYFYSTSNIVSTPPFLALPSIRLYKQQFLCFPELFN